MNREQLAHIVRAAARIADDSEVVILGSQSVLATAEADDLPEAVTLSVEADVAFWGDDDAAKADNVDGAIGELSSFHEMNGYYAQGVSISTAVLPEGWQERVIVFSRPDTEPGRGLCLEVHDLVVWLAAERLALAPMSSNINRRSKTQPIRPAANRGTAPLGASPIRQRTDLRHTQ